MGTPLRVLIVEDSKADAHLLLIELENGGYEPIAERVDTAQAMGEALDRNTWDIILADYVMPNFSGLAALQLLQARGIDLPFIVVSGQIGEDIAVATMKAGASDYILKRQYARLIPAVERELREAEVRRERRKAEQERNQLMEQLRQVNEQLVLRSLQVQEQVAETDAIVTALAEAVVVCGPAGEVLQMNPAAAELLGYSSADPKKPLLEQLAQLRLETADHKPFPLGDSPPARALKGEGVRGVIAVIHRKADAKPVWVSIGAAPILGSDGQPRGGVTIFTDITALCEQQQGADKPEA